MPRRRPTPERGFDRISPVYDALARLFPGDRIQRSQCVYLERVRDARRALIVGGGNGAFLRALLRSGFRGDVVYLDLSGAMIRRARRRVGDGHGARIQFRRADVRELADEAAFDLICTHYVLDVFTAEELGPVLRRLDRALVPGGAWLCADFAPPSGGPLRRGLQRALLGGLYAFFVRVCGIRARRLPPIAEGFAGLGYPEPLRREPARGLLWTALYTKPAAAPQAIRSRVAADSDAQPQSAMATSNSWRKRSSTRPTPA